MNGTDDAAKPDFIGMPWFAILATGRVRLYEIKLCELDAIRKSLLVRCEIEPPEPWSSMFGAWLRNFVWYAGQAGLFPKDVTLLDVVHAPCAMVIGIFVASAEFEPIIEPWFAIQPRPFPTGPILDAIPCESK